MGLFLLMVLSFICNGVLCITLPMVLFFIFFVCFASFVFVALLFLSFPAVQSVLLFLISPGCDLALSESMEDSLGSHGESESQLITKSSLLHLCCGCRVGFLLSGSLVRTTTASLFRQAEVAVSSHSVFVWQVLSWHCDNWGMQPLALQGRRVWVSDETDSRGNWDMFPTKEKTLLKYWLLANKLKHNTVCFKVSWQWTVDTDLHITQWLKSYHHYFFPHQNLCLCTPTPAESTVSSQAIHILPQTCRTSIMLNVNWANVNHYKHSRQLHFKWLSWGHQFTLHF